MSGTSRQPGLFDGIQAAAGATAKADAEAARARMRGMIARLRGSESPPWTDQMGVILDDGAFQRAMSLVPEAEAQALWAEFDAEMERMFAIWAAGQGGA